MKVPTCKAHEKQTWHLSLGVSVKQEIWTIHAWSSYQGIPNTVFSYLNRPAQHKSIIQYPSPLPAVSSLMLTYFQMAKQPQIKRYIEIETIFRLSFSFPPTWDDLLCWECNHWNRSLWWSVEELKKVVSGANTCNKTGHSPREAKKNWTRKWHLFFRGHLCLLKYFCSFDIGEAKLIYNPFQRDV